ncbi:MAG: hypothetical protein ACOYLF_06625 [Blastocatellia bacterium]
MKLYLHCGFPKTGTTALQTWLANNQPYLREHDLDYPDLFRNEEGLAHHRIYNLVESGPSAMAKVISFLFTSSSQSSILLSTEGLSNLLISDQPSEQAFLGLLLQELKNLSIDSTLIFTLRPLDTYVKSIIIQNILYEGLCCRPSDFGAHTIDAFSRAYQNISILLSSKNVVLFPYSMQVNQEIIGYILKGANGCSLNQVVIGEEHTSPSETLVILFLWLNYHGVRISPDLHSYLRFGKSSPSILEEFAKNIVAVYSGYDQFLQQWEPSSNLFHAIIVYYKMAWSSHFGFEASQKADKNCANTLLLRKTVLSDCKAGMLDILARLDMNYEMAIDPSTQTLLTNTFMELVKSGSIEYGKSLFDLTGLHRRLDNA